MTDPIISQDLQQEFDAIPFEELVIARGLMRGENIEMLDRWCNMIHEPIVSDFAKCIVGAARGADAKDVLDVAREFLKAQYPNLYEHLKREAEDVHFSDDLP